MGGLFFGEKKKTTLPVSGFFTALDRELLNDRTMTQRYCTQSVCAAVIKCVCGGLYRGEMPSPQNPQNGDGSAGLLIFI